ncbi:MAG: insulinase family protein, partial [Planctomycetaceae bacterium]|nr:insulinase family protein [Planctomycetaceae bacterium]
PEYPADDVRYVASVEEQIENWKKVQLADVQKVYTDFLGGQHGELAIVGDFDPATARTWIESVTKGWKASQSYAHIPRSGDLAVTASREAINIPDKENATYLAGSVFALKDSDPDYVPLMIGNYVLGSSGLSSRLGDRIRQQEGLSYGVGSFLTASSEDPRTSFLMYAITNPDNMAKVETCMKEEVQRLIDDGITADELALAQKGYLERQTVDRSDDGELTRILCRTLELDRDMTFFRKQETAVANLTLADVSAALKKYISLDRIVVVAAGDFAE